ncbi:MULTISPECIES: ArsR/SmtB family transcription factor [Shouchella]|uniref:Metalloregulator ArsR/SmtB family transcription factor n=2 Tax=Shouchella TaxID=2893057 RepID=A0ABY7WB27_9BACI|nr:MULTISPECIES: metalloregulator ArsR/SmtB family transcription factor [Shouchella]MED4128030.1 metalloregulator ArsR/SmtB family transcription factor [Shouchella miscanthi]WDF05649.1 metalloregulator ArsR/SmtB family transcription factor [Shouchella hunanensis]GAF20609.1 arsenical resistance operon repressor [Bacillus sp. JCM 19047]
MESTTLTMTELTTCLKVIGDPTRFLMLKLVEKKTYCVCEFVEMLGLSQPAVSQHLRKLKDLGVLTEERREQWRYFTLNTTSTYFPVVRDLLQYSDDQDERYLQALEKEGLASC